MKLKIGFAIFLTALCLLSWACSKPDSVSRLSAAEISCAPCGPHYCLNDPNYPRLLEEKKAALRRNPERYPEELIALLDRDGKCRARIERAPDVFTILLVKTNGSRTVPWTVQDEQIAKDEILRGEIVSYYKFNARQAFACCNEPRAEDRPDWHSNLGISKDLAIFCSKSGISIVCQ